MSSAVDFVVDVVDQGVAVQAGRRRYARYVLDPTWKSSPLGDTQLQLFTAWSTPTINELIARRLQSFRVATAEELGAATGLSRPTIVAHLKTLIAQGMAVSEGSRNSPKRRYRWIDSKKGTAS